MTDSGNMTINTPFLSFRNFHTYLLILKMGVETDNSAKCGDGGWAMGVIERPEGDLESQFHVSGSNIFLEGSYFT